MALLAGAVLLLQLYLTLSPSGTDSQDEVPVGGPDLGKGAGTGRGGAGRGTLPSSHLSLPFKSGCWLRNRF